MNIKYHHLLSLAVLPLLAGCTLDEQNEQYGGYDGLSPITLKAMMEGNDDETTRAGTTLLSSNFASSETFYAYFPSNVRVGSTTTASSTTFTTSNSSGSTTPATQPYFNAGASSATVRAYYPYVSGKQITNSTTSFSVETAQNTDANYKKSDLMYATASLTKSSASVTGSLSFSHRMAKILVTANIGTGVTNIQSIRIIGGYRTINIATPETCTLGSTLSNANSTSSYITMYSTTSTSQVNCAALIPPQSISGNFLQIVTNVGTATYSLASSKSFASGRSYQLTITVNAAAVGTTTSISGWTGTGNVTIKPDDYILDLSTLTANKTIDQRDILLTGSTTYQVSINGDKSPTVVLSSVTMTKRLIVNATMNSYTTLVLEGTNTLSGGIEAPPYQPQDGDCELIITGSGTLNININAGNVPAIGATSGTCGGIVIEGGTINATVVGGESEGNIGCGIGSAQDSSVEYIYISGGYITAKGGPWCAGIGCGDNDGADNSCGDITITGGNITATGGQYAAGIGGGSGSGCGNITITGGSIKATGGLGASGGGAGIGSGSYGTCGTIKIDNSYLSGSQRNALRVEAIRALSNARHIGGGYSSSGGLSSVTVNVGTYCTDSGESGSNRIIYGR